MRLLAERNDEGVISNVRLLRRHDVPKARDLTRRETDVATRIARGLSNRQIGEELVIATSTTERHVANILNKLGMRSRAQVAAWAVRQGL